MNQTDYHPKTDVLTPLPVCTEPNHDSCRSVPITGHIWKTQEIYFVYDRHVHKECGIGCSTK